MAFTLALAGCILGYLGFRKAGAAMAEIAVLRAMLAAPPLAAAGPAPVEADPIAAPESVLPAPEPVEAAPPAPARPKIDIEVLLTQRWGVWLGSIALLMAGVFLVRTALEEGWLGPGPRCVAGFLLGGALIAAAQWLRRRPMAVALPLADQAPAALAAGGVAMWLAAAYGAGPLYHLVPAAVAFPLMAAASLAGLALSLVFGRLVAAVGLVAAFVTPLLVQTTDPSLPGLFAYLLLVSAACWTVVRLTAWTWLGWAAAIAGTGWVLFALTLPHGAELWPAGLFVPAAAALTLALLPGSALDHPIGRRFAWAPLLLLALAGLALVAETGDPTMRMGLLLLGPIAMLKAWFEPRLAWLPSITAGIAVATLLAWAIPAWSPTGEAITIEGVVQAVLPGAWAPDALLPLLQTAMGVAVLYAAAGLWGERRSANPLPWAALTAAVPVALLAATYLQVGRFQPRPAWALICGILAALLVGAAFLARRGSIQRAGVHAAGAVAALALGCAIVLDTAWLTVALALMLPALAWIERAADLPPLRRVALAVGGAVLARLVLNPWVLDYAIGETPVLNLLLIAYGIPAVCFALAARAFRRRADDLLVAVLEAGACVFVTVLVILEVHHTARGGALRSGSAGFAENAWQVTALGVLAVLLQSLARNRPRPVLDFAWRAVGALALLGGVLLLASNPFLSVIGLGPNRLLNPLLPAYLFPALLALLASRVGPALRRVLVGYALVAVLMWSAAGVRQAFHPGIMLLSGPRWTDAELWSLSGAWLALAALVMAAGIVLGRRVLRLAALGLIALVAAKVFLIDLAGLTGLWRVASFLGLGLSLIGLGAFYRRFGVRS